MARRRYQTRSLLQEEPDLHLVLCRVSTDEQVEKGNSLEEQADWGLEDALRDTPDAAVTRLDADDEGVTGPVPDRDGQTHVLLISERGISGAVLERPGLDLARELIRSGRVKSLRATAIDRISRDVGHQQLILAEINRRQVRLKLRNFDYRNDPFTHAMLTNLGTWGQLERSLFRERSMAGKRKKAKKGGLTHNPGAYGYRFDKETDTLHPDDSPAAPGREDLSTKADVVKRMYSWVLGADEPGAHAIAQRLNDLGVPSPRGSIWQKATVLRILSNPTYKGTLYLNRHNSEGVKHNKFKPEPERIPRTIRPHEEWREVQVPALVDQVTWLRVQEQLRRLRRRRPGTAQAEYLLSGLLVCGRCHSTIHGHLATHPKTKVKRRYYCCTARSPGTPHLPRCDLRFVRADEIEETIWSQVREWILHPDSLAEIMAAATRGDAGPGDELKAAEAAMKQAREEEEEILDLRRKRLLSRDTAETELAKLQARIAGLARRVAALRAQVEAAAGGARAAQDLQTFVANVRESIDSLDFYGRQQILRRLVAEVVVDPPDIRIMIRLPVPE